MIPDLTCGLDVGTTAIKAALFEVDGATEPIAYADAPSPTIVPGPGLSEANMDDVAEAALTAISRTTRGVDARRIGALGISGTACGAWLVNASGHPVRNAILWNDGRASDTISDWLRRGVLPRVFELSGSSPYPAFTLALLNWLRANEPTSLDAATAVLTAKDWIRYRFTGELATDASDASYGPFDCVNRRWSDELSALCGAQDDVHLLPPIKEETHTAPLLADVAERVGLPEGIPVAMGLTDIVSGTIGAGGLRPGSAVTVLGTSAVSTIMSRSPDFDPPGLGLTAAAPLGHWARTMVNTSGSMTLDWMASLLFDGDVTKLIGAANQDRAAANLVMLPYLSGAGVISPFISPEARGVIAGLRSGHTRADLARAGLEGLSFAVADCYAVMPTSVTDIFTVGGAARSDFLLRLIADATQATVHRIRATAPGARAVGLLAARAADQIHTDEALISHLSSPEITTTFQPGSPSGNYRRYRDLRVATRSLWESWTT